MPASACRCRLPPAFPHRGRRRGRSRGGIVLRLLAALAVMAAVLALAWMLLLPALIAGRFEQATGFRLQAERLAANPLTGHFRLTDATLDNPAGWPSDEFMRIRRLEGTVRLWSWSKRPVEITDLSLDIDTLHVVVAPDGRNNLSQWDDALAALASSGAAPAGAASPVRVDRLRLSVGRMLVADYSRGPTARLLEYRLVYRGEHRSVTRWQPLWDDIFALLRR